VTKLQQELGLNEKQTEKVTEIYKDYRNKKYSFKSKLATSSNNKPTYFAMTPDSDEYKAEYKKYAEKMAEKAAKKSRVEVIYYAELQAEIYAVLDKKQKALFMEKSKQRSGIRKKRVKPMKEAPAKKK